MKKIIVLFITVVGIALFLRFWHLGAVPISPNWDEAALGYNAYALLKTGKDEYGIPFPFVLRSFGNYTPALYSYLAVPSLYFFGLNAFSVRLPSAVMGVLAVVGTFFLTKELLQFLWGRGKRTFSVSLLTMFLLAISPWHIQFSRVAYEGNIALTLVIWGFVFFLMGLRGGRWFILSAIFYGLSLNAYHSPRLFVPLFLLGLSCIFRKRLMAQKTYVVTSCVVGSLFLLPFLYFFTQHQSQQILARFSETSIFSKQQTSATNVFDTAIASGLYEVANGYLSHFSPRWLFITGDNDRHHAPSTGLLYLWEVPFLLTGVFVLFRSNGVLRWIMLLWMVLVPVPASLTSEVPHAVRTLLFLPSWQLLTALGIERWYRLLARHGRLRMMTVALYTPIILFLVFQYLHLYFFQMNYEFSRFWQFGYEHAVNFSEQHRDTYRHVVVSTKLEEPYIFFLFYTKFDPKRYLAAGGTNTQPVKFDIYEFRAITDWSKEKHDGKTLYLLAPDEIPTVTPIHVIRFFDASEAFVFAE